MPFEIGAPTVLFLVRIIIGIVMIYYGTPKMAKERKQREVFEALGFYPGWVLGTIVGVVEIVGGLALLLGVFTQFATLAFAGILLVGAIHKITHKKKFKEWSYELLLLGLCLITFMLGPGSYALNLNIFS